jgi:Tol biopolymer transport system component
MPPKGAIQRRLTFNTKRKYPGIQGPRHWLRSSADGKWIAYLAKDDKGLAQIHLVSPNGGKSVQLTRNEWPVASSFNWSPDGRYIAYAMNNSIFVTDTREGKTFGKSTRMTRRTSDRRKPDAIGIAWSNRGDKIAFCRRINRAGIKYPQIFILTLRRK